MVFNVDGGGVIRLVVNLNDRAASAEEDQVLLSAMLHLRHDHHQVIGSGDGHPRECLASSVAARGITLLVSLRV